MSCFCLSFCPKAWRFGGEGGIHIFFFQQDIFALVGGPGGVQRLTISTPPPPPPYLKKKFEIKTIYVCFFIPFYAKHISE